MLIDVAFILPVAPLTYSVPLALQSDVKVGTPVAAKIRNKQASGYVTKIYCKNELNPEDLKFKPKPILALTDDLPVLNEANLSFVSWLSSYYQHPLGITLSHFIPPEKVLKKTSVYILSEMGKNIDEATKDNFAKRGGKRLDVINLLTNKDKSIPDTHKAIARKLFSEGYLEKKEVEKPIRKLNLPTIPTDITRHRLNDEQAEAFGKIANAIRAHESKFFLLQGVTGSGKTEVYLAAAEKCLSEGRGVIFLVPEIALTPQLYTRVESRFPGQVAVMHSGMSSYQRTEQWYRIQRGQARVALGARSTIFAPMADLGLIIIDEEHESAFKQEDRFRYNARDVATVLAKRNNATLVLGSATPSLESYFSSITGKIERIELRNRVSGKSLPEVTIINSNKESMQGLFSSYLVKKISDCLANKKQTMLFLNRRGYASFLVCNGCGHVPTCPNCSVSLTKYFGRSRLHCHYCNFEISSPSTCTECGSKELTLGTPGTEQVELQAKQLFPSALICRIDRDTVTKTEDLEKKLTAIANKEIDIVVGTQMIAKGHDFPAVELVAIIDADSTLNLPDFRANERSFQLFTQMAGRAGRGDWPGSVVIQTRNTNHPSILCAQSHNYQDFAGPELNLRQTFEYPPYTKLARILLTASSETAAATVSERIVHDLRKLESDDFKVLGPAPALLQKIQNKYRWNILLKSGKSTTLNRYLKSYLNHWRKQCGQSVQISVDVDPVSLM